MSKAIICDLCGEIIEDPKMERVEHYVTKRARYHYWRYNMDTIDVHEACRRKLFGLELRKLPPVEGRPIDDGMVQ